MDTIKTYSTFTTELQVRPDDIDMFNHVHNSRYFDYVQAARYQQMETAYGMSWEKFVDMGFGWVVKTAHVKYKRALTLGEKFDVTTGVLEMNEKSSKVMFEITSKKTGKLCCDGWFEYALIDLKTGRSVKISQEMMDKYGI